MRARACLMLAPLALTLACADYGHLRAPAAATSDGGDARQDTRGTDGGAPDQAPIANDGGGFDLVGADLVAGGDTAGTGDVPDAATSPADVPAPTPDLPPPIDTAAPSPDLSTAPPDLAPPDSGPSATELAFGCPADEALRLCFTFDDIGTGTRLTDHSGRGNHGFLHTARVAGGVQGAALSFSTGAHFAQVPDSESLRLADAEVTYEAWIRPTMSPPDLGADIILGKVDPDYVGWAFALYGNDIRLYVNGNTARGASGVRFTFWNHVAIVLGRDGALVYINGKQVSELLPPLPIPLRLGLVTIGNTNPAIMNDKNRSGYTGEVDVLRIYARVRRPEEICAAADGAWTAGACRPRAVAAP